MIVDQSKLYYYYNFYFSNYRHNTRKYEQVHSDHLHRRIHRRSYKIPAKSYMLNRDNSEMCAIMNGNDNNGGINGGNGGQEDNFFSFD